jgi:sugar lactone lactonase YvrE
LIALGLAAAVAGGCTLVPAPNGNDNDNAPEKAVITTVVGNGIAGDNGDGLDALDTTLYLVQDVTVGPDGNLYFPDWNNHRLRRVIDGKVETIAGTGELGDSQPGSAYSVQFNHPTNLEFDRQGRAVVAAWHNSKIMLVNLETEQVEAVAGTGGRSFGGDGGPALTAILDLPSSVAIDSQDNIFVSDQANFRIRVIEPDGNIFTICGDGTPGFEGDGGPAEEAQLNAPKGQSAAPSSRITLDLNEDIIVADTGNHCIRRIRTVDGIRIIETLAGTTVPGYTGDGGPASLAQLNTPSDVAVGPDGSIYVADTYNHVVRVITPDGNIDTLAGTGVRGFSGDGAAADEAQLDRPYGVDVAPDGTVYVADTHNHRIRRITAKLPDGYVPPDDNNNDNVVVIPCTDEPGSICTYLGTGARGFNGDGKDRLQTIIYWPFDMEFLSDGRVIVLDWNNHLVREVQPDGTLKTVMGTDFVGDGPADLSDLTPAGADPLTVTLNHPTDIVEMPDGDIVIVAWHNHKLREIDSVDGRVRVLSGRGGGFGGDGGIADAAVYNQPAHAVLDPNGNLLMVDQRNQRIRLLSNFAADRKNAIVTTIVGVGVPPGFRDGPALEAQVSFPTGGNPEPTGGLVLDASGNLYFADTNNHRIRMVTFEDGDYTKGTVSTIAGTGVAGFAGDGGPAAAAQINLPGDLEIGPDGRLYFADTNNNAVRRIDLTTGVIETVVGTGERGYDGDGGPAKQAQLNRPFGIAFDADGVLFVSDSFNSRIRKVILAD